MSAANIVLLLLTATGTLYYVFSTLALIRHFSSRRSGGPVHSTPKASLLKPVSGVDAGAKDNWLTFFQQDYPDYEVLFGVLDADDPAVQAVSETIAGCGHASMRIGSRIDGANNKVRILDNLARHATGEILVITDADTRVSAEFLDRITSPFADAKVGVVTCAYRGIEAKTIADALEGLHMTCVFAPGVAMADWLGGIDFGLGAAIAIRRSVLDEIGGFETIVDFLADDFQLGFRAARAGYQVVLSDYVVGIVLSGETLPDVLARELRWSRTTKASRPGGHFGLVCTFGLAYALGFALASGLSTLGWSVLATVAAVRALTAAIGASICLGDRGALRRIYLLPIRDVLSFGIWIGGYLSRTVKWRGRKLRLTKGGKMVGVG